MKVSTTIAPEAPLTAATMLRGPVEDGIKRSAEMGFDGVELQFNLCSIQPDFNKIADLCAKLNMEVCAYATGSLYVKNGLSLIDDDKTIVQRAIEMLQKYIDAAAITGGKLIIGCVRGNLDDRHSKDEYEQRLAKSLETVIEAADKKNIKVVLEAINRYENNYLATAAQVVEFIEKYNLKGMQILMDSFHMNMEETDMLGAIKKAAPYLGHFHSSDNIRYVPGMGTLPFPIIVRELSKNGYDGYLSLECTVSSNENAEAKIGLNNLRKILSSI